MSNKTEEARTKPTAKPALVPKLRFPEFRNAGEWEEKTLGQLGWFIGGGTPSKAKLEYWQGEIPWISSSDLFEDDIHTIDINKFITFEAIEKSATKIVPKGSVLFVSRVGTGKLAINGQDLCTSQDFINFVSAKIYTYYLAYYSLANKSALIGFGQGTSIKGFSKNDVENFKVSFPEKEEQQKIADCLSSVDELITLEARKIDALKAHKKGLMQQLFPAEGKTLPKLRFPEFRDAGEWEEKKAGTLFANRVEDGEEGFPIYSVTMNDGMIKRSSLERRVDDIAKANGNRKALKGDIVYNMMRMWQGAFGVSKEDCMVSPAYVVLSPKSSTCSDFFWCLFKLPKYLHLLTSHSQGLTLDRLRLYYKDFAKILVLIPSLPEQQKIADCLSSMDELIALQTQKLNALKAHKKGLMQQLFPSLDEVRK